MCKTIHQRVRFQAPPRDVYQVLANSKKKVGDRFSAQGGKVTGLHVDFQRNRRIVLAWRRSDFPKGVFSMVTMLLSPTARGGTELKLIHRGVPKDLIPKTEKDWRDLYWKKMKSDFSLSRNGP